MCTTRPSTASRADHDLFSQHLFVTPAVRHLAWLLRSRLLHQEHRDCHTGWPGPGGTDAALLALDRQPQPLLDYLARRPSRRLGLYFEQLYGFALEQCLGQTILAQNLAVRDGGRTLGELDFLVQDAAGERVVHHEIAVKFYLGWTGAGPDDKPPGWYGPDTRDQLRLKLQRLREHQIPLWRSEVGRRRLQEAGLGPVGGSCLALYGYLFGPEQGARPELPPAVAAPRQVHTWAPVDALPPAGLPDRLQVPLAKPDWLGPIQLPGDYQPPPGQMETALELARRRPVLIADLARTSQGFWLECGRRFVVPGNWCRSV